MKLITPKEAIKKLSARGKVKLKCYFCSKIFEIGKNYYLASIKGNKKFKLKYCSSICSSKSKKTKVKVSCKNCHSNFYKGLYQINKTKNNFCSRSCAATYNNSNKKHGIRRSKLEVWLEKELNKMYSNLEIHYNRRDTINSELDIYIPSLKLAFELNGIFHYEPIFGQDKLNQIQNNDQNKFQACQKLDISLCIIDVSSLSYFKETKAQKYLKIIKNLVDQKILTTNTS